jgi:hypothetical protein
MRRRHFLSMTAAAAGAVVVGPWFRGRSHAAPFGDAPRGAPMLPEARRARRVLEVFLYGGLSCWETLYLVEEFGRPGDPQYPNEQFHAYTNIVSVAANCGDPGGEIGRFFAQDADGHDVKLGPFAWRLFDRPDVTARMRLIVQRHQLEPHEAAVPQALTGRPVGQPAAAGLGAHVQRYFVERAGAARQAPFSYVFATGGISGDNVSAAAAAGVHPGVARPLLVKVDNAQRLVDLLERPAVGGGRDGYDRLMNVYLDQYQRRLTWPEGELAGAVRSARVADLAQAHRTVENVDSIRGVMTDAVFAPRGGAACGTSSGFDVPGVSLAAARHLLTHPDEPARYVCVSDIGLREAVGGGGYDTHELNSVDTARNFDNLLRNLLSIINAPGEDDPTKLSLDDTLIILNTEFGRTPYRQGDTGRNHHPYGYVTAFIGGPITASEQGIYGNIRASSSAGVHATPAENRAAALLALGIWPFSPEAFAVSDVDRAQSEEEGAELAIRHYLGVAL